MYCSSGLFSLFCIAVLYEYKEGGYMRINGSQYLLSWWSFGNLPAVGFCAAIAFCAGRQCTFHS